MLVEEVGLNRDIARQQLRLRFGFPISVLGHMYLAWARGLRLVNRLISTASAKKIYDSVTAGVTGVARLELEISH